MVLVRYSRSWALVVGVALLSGQLRAEPVPSLDLRGYRPPTHPEALLSLEPTSAPGPGEWNLGGWLSYAYRSVVVTDTFRRGEVVPIEHQLSLDLVGGIGLGERLGLGATLPMVLAQDGDDPPALLGTSTPPSTALGDVTFDARATLLPQGELGGFGLAVLGRVGVPTGSPTSYVSEVTTRSEIRLLGELGILGLSLRASAGARVRGGEQRFAGGTFGHDLPWAVGFVLRPQVLGIDRQGNYLFGLDAHGAVALEPSFGSAEESPAALALAARRALGDASLTLGVELPLSGAQGVPIVRAIAAVGWAPRTHDEDGDGIEDDEDACRSLAEDRDGFEDADGCPDFDNDGDGVADGDDRCPKELEDLDDFQDEDGCPDPDNDRDGVEDKDDACPNEPGVPSTDPKLHGCKPRDRDRDGITDAADKCPRRAEDRDGFRDEDGCPDPDNDRDGVKDADDACPLVAGRARSDPKLSGCPSPDRDGDTYEDSLDGCPDAAEVFDGRDDADGCPEAGAPELRPLARFEPAARAGGARLLLRTTGAIRLVTKDGGVRVAPASEPIVRAVAALLNAHPDHVLMVAVRPAAKSPEAEQAALTQSFAIVDALRSFTYRDDVAETIGWAALGRVPGAARPEGIGFLVLSPVPPKAPHVLPKEPGAAPATRPRKGDAR